MNKKIGPLKVWQLAALGAAVGLYMLYRFYTNRNSTAPASTGATDTSGLIDPTTGLPFAQEGIASGSAASDTSGAMAPSGLDALAQSLMDLQGINEELQAFGFPGIAPATGSSAGSASGSSGASQVTSTTGGGGGGATTQGHITTHKGGPFYKWYVKVTGHAPPATVSTSNPLYALWKAGAKANQVVRPGGHKNPGHTTTTHTGGGNRNQKSSSSSAHGSAHAGKSAKPVAPPNHQRQTSGVTGGVGVSGANTPKTAPSQATATAPKGAPKITGGVSASPPRKTKSKSKR